MITLPPLPLALPAPSWHTADARSPEFMDWLWRLSDAELIRLYEYQQQAQESFYGTDRDEAGLHWSDPRRIAITARLGAAGRWMAHEDWMATADRISGVLSVFVGQMASRFRYTVQRRNENLAKGRRKARAAA